MAGFNDNLLLQVKTEGSPLADGDTVVSLTDTVSGFIGTAISGANQAAIKLDALNGFASYVFTSDAYQFNNPAFGDVTIIALVKSTGTAQSYVFGTTPENAIIKNYEAGKWSYFSPMTTLADITNGFQIVVCNVLAMPGSGCRLGNIPNGSTNFGEFEFIELDVFSRLTAPQITEKTDVMNQTYFGITPPTGNTAPTVSAGADQTITLPSTANLSGTANDDGFGGSTLTTVWSKVSGPGTVTFANANALNTAATFGTAGVYVLRLTASDGTLSTMDDVTITVNPGGQPNNSVRITINDVAGETGYKVRVATNSNMTGFTEYDLPGAIAPGQTKVVWHPASSGNTYYAQIQSYNGNGTRGFVSLTPLVFP